MGRQRMGRSAAGSVEPESAAASGWLPGLGYQEWRAVGGVVWRWHPEPFCKLADMLAQKAHHQRPTKPGFRSHRRQLVW